MNRRLRKTTIEEDARTFGFTVREIAFMRSMSDAELTGWMDTLRAIWGLPTSDLPPLRGVDWA